MFATRADNMPIKSENFPVCSHVVHNKGVTYT